MKNLVLFIFFTLVISISATANNSNKLKFASTNTLSTPSTSASFIFNHVEIDNVMSTERQAPLMDEEIKKVKSPVSKEVKQAPANEFNSSKQGV